MWFTNASRFIDLFVFILANIFLLFILGSFCLDVDIGYDKSCGVGDGEKREGERQGAGKR